MRKTNNRLKIVALFIALTMITNVVHVGYVAGYENYQTEHIQQHLPGQPQTTTEGSLIVTPTPEHCCEHDCDHNHGHAQITTGSSLVVTFEPGHFPSYYTLQVRDTDIIFDMFATVNDTAHIPPSFDTTSPSGLYVQATYHQVQLWWYQNGERREDKGVAYTFFSSTDNTPTQVELIFDEITAQDAGLWVLRAYICEYYYVQSEYELSLRVQTGVPGEHDESIVFTPLFFGDEVNLNLGGQAGMYMGFHATHIYTPREFELWWYHNGTRRTDLGSQHVVSQPICTNTSFYESVSQHRYVDRFEYVETIEYEEHAEYVLRTRIVGTDEYIYNYDFDYEDFANIETIEYLERVYTLLPVVHFVREHHVEREYYIDNIYFEYECVCYNISTIPLHLNPVELTDAGEWTLHAYEGIYYYQSPYLKRVMVAEPLARFAAHYIGFTPFSIPVPVASRQDIIDAIANSSAATDPLILEITASFPINAEIDIPMRRHVHLISDNTPATHVLTTNGNRHFVIQSPNDATNFIADGDTSATFVLGLEGNPDPTAYGNRFILQGSGSHGGHGGSINMQHQVIYALNAGTRLIMWGGTIQGNTTTGRGGAIHLGHSSIFTMHGGLITDNESTQMGGAIGGQSHGAADPRTSHIILYGGTISHNRQTRATQIAADGNPGDGGGAIALTGQGSTLTMHGGAECVCPDGCSDIPVLIYGNTAGRYGGGVMISRMNSPADTARNVFTMYGGTIQNNRVRATSASAGGIGGGVAILRGGEFTMHGGLIDNNQAYRDGGGVYIQHGTGVRPGDNRGSIMTMDNGTISNNVAGWCEADSRWGSRSGNGGGIAHTPGNISGTPAHRTHIEIFNGNITGNVARSSWAGCNPELVALDACNNPNCPHPTTGSHLPPSNVPNGGNGGGIHMGRNSVLYIHNTNISNNHGELNGGGIATSHFVNLTPSTANDTNIIIRNISLMENRAGLVDGPNTTETTNGNLGGGIFLGRTSNLVIHNGDISHNRAINLNSGSGGGIATDTTTSQGSHITIYNATISHNFADGAVNGSGTGRHRAGGGGILLQGVHSTLTMFDGEISHNHGNQGGGVAVRQMLVGTNSALPGSSARFDMYGGRIEFNRSFIDIPYWNYALNREGVTNGTFGGGGVYLSTFAMFNMHAGSINNNTAYNRGAGVLTQHSFARTGTVFNMFGGEIFENVIPSVPEHLINPNRPSDIERLVQRWGSNQLRGGGVFINGTTSVFNMYGGEIHHNLAGYGAGVRIENAGSGRNPYASFHFLEPRADWCTHPIPAPHWCHVDDPNRDCAQPFPPGFNPPVDGLPQAGVGAEFNFHAGVIRDNYARSTGVAGGGVGVGLYTNTYIYGPGVHDFPDDHPARSPNREVVGLLPIHGADHNGAMIINNVARGNGGGMAIFESYRYANRGARVILDGGQITGNTAISEGSNRMGGGGVFVRGPATRFYLKDGYIQGNHTNYVGGGMRFDQGSLIMTGGYIRNNIANAYGGGIFMRPAAPPETNPLTQTIPPPYHIYAHLYGGVIEGNTSNTSGGGIGMSTNRDGNVTLNMPIGSTAWIRNNTALGSGTAAGGGGVFMTDRASGFANGWRATFNMYDGFIGGTGVVGDNTYDLPDPISGASIYHEIRRQGANTAPNGGGLLIRTGDFNMTGGVFDGNRATGTATDSRPYLGGGGAIWVNTHQNNAFIDIRPCDTRLMTHPSTGETVPMMGSFIYNRALGGHGGAIFANPTHAVSPLPRFMSPGIRSYHNVINAIAYFPITRTSHLGPHGAGHNIASEWTNPPDNFGPESVTYDALTAYGTNYQHREWWRYLTNYCINYVRRVVVVFDWNGGWNVSNACPPGSHTCNCIGTCDCSFCICDYCKCDVYERFEGGDVGPAFSTTRDVPVGERYDHVFLGWVQRLRSVPAYVYVYNEEGVRERVRIYTGDYIDSGEVEYVVDPITGEYVYEENDQGYMVRVTRNIMIPEYYYQRLMVWCTDANDYIPAYRYEYSDIISDDDVREWLVRYDTRFIAQWAPAGAPIAVSKIVTGNMGNPYEYFGFTAQLRNRNTPTTRYGPANNMQLIYTIHPTGEYTCDDAPDCLCCYAPHFIFSENAVTDADGNYRFYLRHGQTISFHWIPTTVTVQITEDFHPAYHTSIHITRPPCQLPRRDGCDLGSCDCAINGCECEDCRDCRYCCDIFIPNGRDTGRHYIVFGETHFTFTNTRDQTPPMSATATGHSGNMFVLFAAMLSAAMVMLGAIKRRRRAARWW